MSAAHLIHRNMACDRLTYNPTGVTLPCSLLAKCQSPIWLLSYTGWYPQAALTDTGEVQRFKLALGFSLKPDACAAYLSGKGEGEEELHQSAVHMGMVETNSRSALTRSLVIKKARTRYILIKNLSFPDTALYICSRMSNYEVIIANFVMKENSLIWISGSWTQWSQDCEKCRS